MAKKIKWNYIIWGIVLVLLLNFSAFIIPPTAQSVADIDGKACTKDSQCPCWGTYKTTDATPITYEAYGLGTASCVENKCDVTYCLDVQPVGEWLKAHPFQWIKDNIKIAALIMVGALIIAFWPGR